MQPQRHESCPNCHRSVQSSRLPIHIHMCSTSKLRQSRIFTPKNDPNLSQCMFCHQRLPLMNLQLHMSVCHQRLVGCQICGELFPWSLMPDHLDLCRDKKNKSKLVNGKNKQIKEDIVILDDSAQKNQKHPSQSQITMDNLLTGLNIIGSKLVDRGNKIAKFIAENKGPALSALSKLKQDIYYRLQDVFLHAASQPNVDGLPRDKIRSLQRGQYKARNNGQEQQLCTICYCEFQDQQQIKILHCRHIFHPQCIDKWMRINSKCPLCKNDQLRTR